MGDWNVTQWIVFLVPAFLVFVGVVIWLFLRRTVRTRIRVEHQLREDPDINEWLVVFNWSRKVLYGPTIVASFGACIAMLIIGDPRSLAAQVVGAVWFCAFFINFLIDEYEISVKLLLLVVLVLAVLALWLAFLGWMMDFLRLFKRVAIGMNYMGYLLIGLLFTIAVAVSWLRGLFYYVAITPNYMNIQVGPTETGEQISREEYSTRVDTGDFLERLGGFGRIVITFSDQRRQPLSLLVGRIGKKAARLESIRGKLAVDRHQADREGIGPDV